MTPYCFFYINDKGMRGKEERQEGKKEGKEGGSKS